jgi:hypothetical protein
MDTQYFRVDYSTGKSAATYPVTVRPASDHTSFRCMAFNAVIWEGTTYITTDLATTLLGHITQRCDATFGRARMYRLDLIFDEAVERTEGWDGMSETSKACASRNTAILNLLVELA